MPESQTQDKTKLPTAAGVRLDDAILEEIHNAIRGVRFGTVQLIVQDGRIVQIDKTEKIRLV